MSDQHANCQSPEAPFADADEVSPGAEVTAVAHFELCLNAPKEPQSPASSLGIFDEYPTNHCVC